MRFVNLVPRVISAPRHPILMKFATELPLGILRTTLTSLDLYLDLNPPKIRPEKWRPSLLHVKVNQYIITMLFNASYPIELPANVTYPYSSA